MIWLVRIAKWVLLLGTICWAIYSANAFLFLARTFPSPEPFKQGVSELIASAQGYAVVFGPVIVALILLLIRWPGGSKRNQKRAGA